MNVETDDYSDQDDEDGGEVQEEDVYGLGTTW